MEGIVTFLIQAIASGTAGHYIKKALTRIDAEVGALISAGADVKEIEKVIERKNVSAEVKDVFEESIKTSIIISDGLSIAGTPDDIVQTMQSVVSLGFDTAYQENFDLVLPGSPLSADSLSVFERSSALQQDVKVDDRSVSWNRFKAKMFIFSMPASEVQSYWKAHVKKIKELRADSAKRLLKVGPDFPAPDSFNLGFEVASLTGGTVRFYSVPKDKNGNDLPQVVPYGDWNSGILAMLAGIKQIKDAKYLSVEDADKLRLIGTKIDELRQ